MKTSSSPVKKVHYIIAVHGIGEQRKNETVLPIISQFAAARHERLHHTNLLTLGLLASQSTDTTDNKNTVCKDWIELAGIPSSPDSALKDKRWQPQVAASPKGENLRFLDFVWSDVTREQHLQVGQTAKDWSDALINRLQVRKELGVQGVDWIIYLLANMQKGMLFTQTVLNIRAQSVSNRIFNDFLGDVELYGDFPNTRGRAVRLFHEMMAKLHADHIDEFKDCIAPPTPQYTIIAHSLGTVMTLDAITYAYANQKSRESTEVLNEPDIAHYPGYDGALFSHEHSMPEHLRDLYPKDIDPKTPLSDLKPKNTPPVDWVQYLTSYVTLGSPIDKYLALWTENYQHFNDIKWFDDEFVKKRTSKIRHFNYSDEQDPVGHELNILETTPVWQTLMEKGEDVVFARYAIPGVAHVKYWDDYDLFRRILDVAIDKREESLDGGKKPQGYYVEWFKKSAFWGALGYSYLLVPIIGWLIATYSIDPVIDWLIKFFSDVGDKSTSLPLESTMKGCFEQITQACQVELRVFPILPSFIFVVTLILTHILMKLVIMWRLLLVISRREESPMREKHERKTADNLVQLLIYGTPILWGALLIATLCPFIQDGSFLITARVWLTLALLISLDIALIFLKTHKHWNKLKETMAKNFSEYVNQLESN
jgi:hypothetical protein